VAVRPGAPPVSTRERIARARRVALAVAGRLRGDAVVTDAIERTARRTSYPDVYTWRPESLAYGTAGLAAVCAAVDRADPGQGWDAHAHRLLSVAVDALPAARSLGLFDGACGVAFAAAVAGYDGDRYAHLLTRLDERIAGAASTAARSMAARGGPPPMAGYDVISGAAGWAIHLAGRPESPPVEAALIELENLLTGLARLTAAETPVLALPPRMLPAELAELAPYGYVDCGVAHGYPGVLTALLTIRERRGRTRLDEVLGAGADWLSRQLIEDDRGPYWPYRVLLGPDGAARTRAHRRPHDGWCYGTPGVAWVLWRIGMALDVPGFRRTALAAMRAACARAIRPAAPVSPLSATLCHGRAGVHLLASRLADAAGSAGLSAAADTLLDGVLAEYDDAAPLGYRDVENAGTVTDNPGLLNGAPGVALALLAASSDGPAGGTLRWSDAFGITGIRSEERSDPT
jgi:hypothetical protein